MHNYRHRFAAVRDTRLQQRRKNFKFFAWLPLVRHETNRSSIRRIAQTAFPAVGLKKAGEEPGELIMSKKKCIALTLSVTFGSGCSRLAVSRRPGVVARGITAT